MKLLRLLLKQTLQVALSAVLQQNGRPVAFWLRTLAPNKRRYANVEKEASAIIESVRKWSHFLMPQKFTIVTDQNFVTFMFNNKSRRKKIKNDKIERWKIELSQFNYDIVFREGKYLTLDLVLVLPLMHCIAFTLICVIPA